MKMYVVVVVVAVVVLAVGLLFCLFVSVVVACYSGLVLVGGLWLGFVHLVGLFVGVIVVEVVVVVGWEKSVITMSG